ncbi:cupin, partial [Pseudomonas coronafaciens]
MGLRFIFMLTRNDRTVADASQQLQTALDLGVRHIGFKDIGLPIEQLKSLNAAIKAGGATSYLEVVSLDRESEIVSAKAAVEIGVDILLGGTRVDDVLPIITETGIQYFPFPGLITGHPSVLEGSIEEIVDSAKAMAARDGVHGLDLLAYRSAENVPELMRAVCAAVSKPVYVAGSIASPERIAIVQGAGAAGFTIGTAALDGQYPADGKDVPSQLNAILRDVAALN